MVSCHPRSMNMRNLIPEFVRNDGEVIATFGHARLIKRLAGDYELVGGSKEDRAQALEWISMFMHEAVVLR